MVRQFATDGPVVSSTMGDLDITNHRAVMERVARERPGLIVNCAAYNDVDGAEENPLVALEVNAFAVRSLAEAASASGAAFVHFSTDFVFDGRATTPYTEADLPRPRSFYAASKLAGEWMAREAGRAYVLRVESLFGGGAEAAPVRSSSVDRIIDALLEGRGARVFADRTVSPSYTEDVARATRALVARRAPVGLYHCVNTGACTWHGLGQEVVRLLGVPDRLVSVPVGSVPMRAERPQHSALDNRKLAGAGFDMPTWQDALSRYLERRVGRFAG